MGAQPLFDTSNALAADIPMGCKKGSGDRLTLSRGQGYAAGHFQRRRGWCRGAMFQSGGKQAGACCHHDLPGSNRAVSCLLCPLAPQDQTGFGKRPILVHFGDLDITFKY